MTIHPLRSRPRSVAATLARLGLTVLLALLALVQALAPTPVAAQSMSQSNSSVINIPDSGTAAPYPSPITIAGLPGSVTRVTATLTGLYHTFPSDIDILLVGPGGQRTILMSDAGGGNNITNTTLTFDDNAATTLGGGLIASGSYQPTDFEPGDFFPAPAPVGPYVASMAVFNGSNPNGQWRLFALDDAGADIGTIASGWSLTVETMTVEFADALPSVAEDGGSITISVGRSGGSTGAVSVNYATSNGSASAGSDYGAVSGTLNWPNGDSSDKTFTVPIIDDSSVEGDETINLTLSSVVGAALGSPSTATLTLVENDSGLRFSAATYSVPESGGSAAISVQRVGGSTGALSVSYATSDGTATQPGDYSSSSGTLTWADGDSTPKAFFVPIVSDSLSEPAETINLTLSGPTGAVLVSPSTAVLTIVDFANSGAISIPTSGTATPYPSTIDVAGLAGSVTRVTATLHNLSHSFPDDIDILLVGPTGQAVMLMSDVGGANSISNVTLTLADSAGSNLPNSTLISSGTFRPTDMLPGDSLVPPAPAAPYASTLAAFNALDPNGTWSLYVLDDTAGLAGTIAGGWSLTIDTPGSLQFSASDFSAGEADGTTSISVSRTGGSVGVVSVDYATSDGSATQPGDYSSASGTLNWPSGDIAPKSFNITVNNDTLTEPAETVALVLSGATGGAALGSPSIATLTIVDDEVAGSLQFSAADYSVNENGGTATITVSRVNGNQGAVSVDFATSDGTALAGTDYGALAGTLNWPDGDSTDKSFSFPIIDDTSVEPNKSVNLTLSNPTGVATLGVPTTAVLTILENDVGIILSSSSYYAAEGNVATITARRIGGSGGAVSANLLLSDGSATAPDDYDATGGTFSWADGDSADKVVSVSIPADTLSEGAETVNLSLDTPSGGAQLLTPNTALLSILDFANTEEIKIPAAGVPTLYPSAITVAGVEGSVSKVTATLYGLSHTWPDDLDILLVGPLGQRVLLMSDAGGSLDVNDLTLTFDDAAAGTLPDNSQIAAGTYRPSNFEAPVDSFASPAPAGPYGSALAVYNTLDPNGTWNLFVIDDEGGDAGTIASGWSLTIDTPGGLRFSATTSSVNEGDGTATLTVNRTGGRVGAISVQYATSDGTASAGSDYSSTSGTLNWPSGDITARTISVPISEDTLIEGDETVLLALSSPTGGAALGSPANSALTIIDNEGPVSFDFSATNYSVNENGGTATISVQRSGDNSNPLSVNYATSPGSATASGDYGTVAGTLSWGAGDSADKSFTVPIVDDSSVEGDETVNLTLSAPTGGAAIGAPALLTISDDDVGISFSASGYSVSENDTTATITARRSGGSQNAVSVSYTTSDGTATAPDDYATSSGTLSWGAGDSADKSFTVSIVNDTLTEGDERVFLNLTNPSGAQLLGANPVELTIHDFANTSTVVIPDSGAATTYPATIEVTGVVGSVSRVTATLHGLTHSFPDDLDILLVGPLGQQVLLMSDVGGGNALTGATLTFDDDAAAALPDSGAITDGSYKPSDSAPSDSFSGPAPAGPYGSALAAFNALDPNGTWQLFVFDDTGGNAGELARGWSLTFDTPGSLQFSAATYSVAESGGIATISVSRTGGSQGLASVSYASSDGTATQPGDYSSASGTLTWADGEAGSKSFDVAINDDLDIEGDEAINLTLSSATGGATLGSPSAATLTIADGELAGSLQFSAAATSINEDAGVVIITVSRTGGSGGQVTVNYASANGSASTPDDYTATSGALTWAAGDIAAKTFAIPIVDDTAVEGDETVALSLSSPTGGAALGSPSSATLTITDNEVAGSLQFGAASFSANENGGTALVSVSRINGSGGQVSVNYATSDGTATQPGDYTATSGTLTWAAGDTAAKTISVPIINDPAVESAESINLTLSLPTGGATLGSPATATLTIVDNDIPVRLAFSATTYNVSESAGLATITVNRVGGSEGAVSVDFLTANLTATAPEDFTSTSGTLSWAAGDTTPKSFTVEIHLNSAAEGNESLRLSLSNPTGVATLGEPNVATLVIEEPGLAGEYRIFLPAVFAKPTFLP